MPRTKFQRPLRSNPGAVVKGRPGRFRKRIPVTETNLTPTERALLPDPDCVTEDDADAIIGMRRGRTEKPIPLEKVLKRYGY